MSKKAVRIAGVVFALLVAFAIAMRLTSAPEREMKDLIADGEFAQAADLARDHLARNPGNAEIKALGTEALLKARLPEWVAAIKARNFDRADTVLAGMKEAARHNDDAHPLLVELEWMGGLERFVMGRGGPEAPVRMYADEDRIRTLLRQWENGTQKHQRAFATINAAAPAFEVVYTEALSHLRKLQSDEAVYLAAIERLKTSIADELKKNDPAALEPILKEYAEKYPRIGGLDVVRQDLQLYTEIDSAAREHDLARLSARVERARFATPPFQGRFKTMATSEQMPPANLLSQYQSANKAWREGEADASFAALEKLDAGPWTKSVAGQIQRRKGVVEQYAALQKTRGSRDYDERLLTFYSALDPDDDVHFIRALEPDVSRNRDKALARAQELMNRAATRWRQYQDNGPIEGAQRLETSVSNQFRTQAKLLTEARQGAQQGLLIARQLKADYPPQWNKLRNDITTEAEQQRKAVQDLRMVLEPGLLKEKLALLGGSGNEQ